MCIHDGLRPHPHHPFYAFERFDLVKRRSSRVLGYLVVGGGGGGVFSDCGLALTIFLYVCCSISSFQGPIADFNLANDSDDELQVGAAERLPGAKGRLG
jgi:hypothetical protein